jgi:hypothetical protein
MDDNIGSPEQTLQAAVE